jgi:hypothetical protein
MDTAATILHREAGYPRLPRFSSYPKPVFCAICGLVTTRGLSFEEWVPPTATDWDLWHCAGEQKVICEACAWVRAGRPPDGLRNQSHVWDEEHGHRRINRLNRKAVRESLLGCLSLASGVRWLMAVATNGRNHVVPRAPINTSEQQPYGVAHGDEQVIIRTVHSRWTTLDTVEMALAHGIEKRWILHGGPSPSHRSVPLKAVIAMNRELHHLRGTADLELAVFLGESAC